MKLAEQQAALVAALAGTGDVPPGFDPARVRAAASALAFKRARAAAQAWPGLRAMLGDDFRNRFAAYASTTPLPQHGGPLADGRAFVRYLAARLPLSDDVTLQALSFDLRRSWLRMRFASLHDAGCLVAAIGDYRVRLRLPRLGR
jgi:hypothetical protein